MKISEVRVIVACPGRNFVLVKIITDKGAHGVGDATLNGRELAVVKVLEEYIGPWLIGKDPDRIEDIWQEIFRGTYWRGGPVLMTALAGIDIALWDIKGKRAGLPIYSLLGGKTREKIRVYKEIEGEDFEHVLGNCQKATSEGHTALRPGAPEIGVPGLSEDIWEPEPYLQMLPRLFKYLRNNLSEDIDLLHDVHGRISPIQACRLAKSLEPYNLFYLEDPIRPEHKESFRLLRSHTTVPVAAGEHYFNKWDCTTLISEQLIDYLRVDILHCGGISEVKKLAAMAEPYYIEMAFHGPKDMTPIGDAANVHVDLSIPNFGIQEWNPPTRETKDVIIGGPEHNRGFLTIPDTPGLGVDIDEEAAKKYPYKRAYLPTFRREDGSVTNW